jgi:conjugal transfer pilus assembly protein TrbC
VPVRTDRRPGRRLLAAALCVLPFVALAQAPQWPTAEDIARALEARPFPGAQSLGTQPLREPPRIEPKRAPIDVEALAKRGAALAAPASDAADPPTLRIFITLEMPRASLERLIEQAARSGAVIVLRGLKVQSMRQTLAVVGQLIGERRVAWLIDPQAFTRYGVQTAPTFVLTLADDPVNVASDEPANTVSASRGACGSHCPTPSAFVSVAGDVSLHYALEAMVGRRPDAASRAAPILARLR